MTISRKQIVSEVIELCGGRNVFAGLAPLVPQVAIESVLAADPEAIFTADERGSTALLRRDRERRRFAAWRRHPRLRRCSGRWLYALNGDAISRQGPRIVDGATAVCGALDEVRARARAPLKRSQAVGARARRAQQRRAPSRTSAPPRRPRTAAARARQT